MFPAVARALEHDNDKQDISSCDIGSSLRWGNTKDATIVKPVLATDEQQEQQAEKEKAGTLIQGVAHP